jgi:hypothetical protein
MRLSSLFVGLAAIGCASSASFGQVTFSTNRTSWVASVGGEANVAQWRFYAGVLEGSDEVASVPAVNTDLGQTVSFSTPDLPFQLKAAQPGATLIFREAAGWAGDPPDFLSIGKANVFEDDDLHITFSSGCVRGVGVLLFDNSADSGEQVRVYDTSGNLIGTRSGLAAFIGITSTIPIGRVEVDESPTADDIGTTGLDIVDCTRPAAVRLVTNEAQWHTAADLTGSPEGLPSTDAIPSAEFILQADEVLTTPADDTDVGPTLTFSGFDPGFFLQSLEPSAGLVFNDSAFASMKPLLSVGRVDVHEDDDFILGIEGCAPSVAFLLEDNGEGTDETLLVYDDGGGLMGMNFLPRSTGSIFTGIVASRPIGSMWVDEDSGGDDIALLRFAFIAPIAASPSALDICQGGDGSLSLAAAIEYVDPQWRRNGVPLSDGPTGSGSVISGSSTSMLTIENATLADAGSYDCVASSACGETIAVASNVRVCVADFDCTGFVDTDDFTAFVLEFELGNDSADVDRTGFVDTDDFTYFVLAFEAGC